MEPWLVSPAGYSHHSSMPTAAEGCCHPQPPTVLAAVRLLSWHSLQVTLWVLTPPHLAPHQNHQYVHTVRRHTCTERRPQPNRSTRITGHTVSGPRQPQSFTQLQQYASPPAYMPHCF
jgi:hypothetical protein